MNRRILYIVLAICAIACSKIQDFGPVEELATQKSEYTVDKGGNTFLIPVFSNGGVKVTVEAAGGDWVTLDKDAFNRDENLKVTVADNSNGVRRMAQLFFELDGTQVTDTVKIYQEGGLEQVFACAPVVNVDGVDRQNSFQSVSGVEKTVVDFVIEDDNVPHGEIKVEVGYEGYGEAWVSGWSFEDNLMKVNLLPNGSAFPRRATIVASYVDGWQEMKQIRMTLLQSAKDGSLGREISAEEVRIMASEEGTPVRNDYLMAGVIVSDCTSCNMELNPLLDYNKLDSKASLRTAYLQPETGAGFKLVFDNEEENILTFGTKVKLDLFGCTLSKKTDPERIVISGLRTVNITEISEGSVPVRSKTVSQLDDDDIYTYVTLKDTEFAFKRGSYLDIYENSAYSFMDGWATLLIDGEGSGIYAPVNVACDWRRTGDGLPSGIGPTSGIIVSDIMPRLGDAGRYQIRVIDKSGFGQEVFGESGWEEHAGWYYKDNVKSSSILDVIVGTKDGNGIYYSENKLLSGAETEGKAGNSGYTSGVYYNARGNSNNGNVDASGMAWIMSNQGWYEWEDGKVKDYKGFVFEFTDIPSAATGLLFTFDFGFGNAGDRNFAYNHPAHWCLEYADGDGAWTLLDKDAHMFGQDNHYVHMRPLPWPTGITMGENCETAAQAGMGFTQHSYLLPASAVQTDGTMRLRLRPYDNRLVRLTKDYMDDIEGAYVSQSSDIYNGLRLRFGTISLRYR